MKYLIICGPTGSGKSSLAMQLAAEYNSIIIGADSRQIYKNTTIGTAKPSQEDRQKVPHQLVDFLDLSEDYSAFKFAQDAAGIIEQAISRGTLPLVVGGTGLYLKALTEGMFEAPEVDKQYRRELEQIAEEQGTEGLHRKLANVDPITAERLEINDTFRIIRALEIFKQTGRSITDLQKGNRPATKALPSWIGVMPDRKSLYKKINKRVDQMIIDGFEQEVRELEPYLEHIIKKKIVGYADMIDFVFKKTLTREEAIEKVKQHHRNYAKRQITWFKKVENVNWLDPESSSYQSDVSKLCGEFLKTA